MTQSSTDWGGLAPRAVDGNLNGVWESASITATREEYRPWWTVDLGKGYDIGSIQLWNRVDACCTTRLADFYVSVSDVPFVSGDLDAVLNQSGVWSQHIPGVAAQTTTINVGRSGRYVRVQLNGTNFLSLAEVQVFAVTQPTATPSLVPTKSSKPYSLQPNTPVYQANFAQSSEGCNWMCVVGQAFDLKGMFFNFEIESVLTSRMPPPPVIVHDN